MKRRIFKVLQMKWLATCFLIGAAFAASGQSMSLESFQSVFAPQDVALDTDPAIAFWQGAKPVYAEVDHRGNLVPAYRTEVRSRWTSKNLYLLFICPYQELYLKPSPDTKEETNELWNWDVAELFIGSDFQDIERYREFEVSPQGEWTDLDINLALPHHETGWTWNSGFEVAARIDAQAHVWYGAMRIPFKSIDERAPAAGNVFRANLFRSQGPPGHKQAIAWKAPMADTFHTPERFGKLELVK
jgi:hypothetical protein